MTKCTVGLFLGVVVATSLVGCSEPEPMSIQGLEFTANIAGVREPRAVPAQEVRLNPDEQVIGVSVGDKHRAYLVRALSMPPDHVVTSSIVTDPVLGNHIVNDRLDDQPISVTYCDVTSCARVFTSEDRETLDLAVGGWSKDSMLLRFQGRNYHQADHNIPLTDYEFHVSSWGEWKSLHPNTDLYLGS